MDFLTTKDTKFIGSIIFYILMKISFMKNSFASNFLASTKKQFTYYQLLGDRTFEQLSDDDLFWQSPSENNSIAIIVNHMHGNMMSRWTDFLTTDGEKDFRNRDQEFEYLIKTRADLNVKWLEGWKVLFTALESVNEDNFDQLVYIRNQGHTITEAINRQLAHYAYHVGQIVLIGQMRRGKDWQSLSIPKGASKKYNQQKFAQEKKRGHFTDEFLNENGEG